MSEFIYWKIADLESVSLPKNELLHRYFSIILPPLQEHLRQETVDVSPTASYEITAFSPSICH